ncbi:MAG: hypothetical protein ACRDK7_10220 [Solirubrobacteraceae bacterium]
MRATNNISRAHLLVASVAAATAVLGLCALAMSPGAARASQNVSISAAFTPERLGAPTTISLGFEIQAAGAVLPSPLIGLNFSYPPNLGLATSDLGTATCQPAPLETFGVKVCPPNSRMGGGTALAKFRVGSEIYTENASLAIVAGPSRNGYVNMLIAATGLSPVKARILMSTLLLPGHLRFTVPLVPSLPEGENVSVVTAHVTLGGNFTYYEHRHGKKVAFKPTGVVLPRQCPRGGFRFAATFSFLDGSKAEARTVVACPASRVNAPGSRRYASGEAATLPRARRRGPTN